MSFLLDTNVLSEGTARQPDANVVEWLTLQSLDAIHISVVTIGEIDSGIARLAAGVRRDRLQLWRDTVVERTGRRLLTVDLNIARAWGVIRAKAQADQRTMPAIDALIAATAEVHGLTLVTRNERDFEVWGGPVLNPWLAA